MKLSNFDYNLSKELIAQYPLKERDSARLLVLNRQEGTIEHRIFKDIVDYLNKDDLLVLNNTKVLHSRLNGSRISGGKVEVLLLKRKDGLAFDALIKPSRLKLGEKIIFNGSTTPIRLTSFAQGCPERSRRTLTINAQAYSRRIDSGKIYGVISGKNQITFNTKDINVVYNFGLIPLPPYIKRAPEDLDNIYYQTVYAHKNGSVASPTAGLHFTEELIKKIESLGINIAYITLHVGYATFKPVSVDDITMHKMEPEYFEITEDSDSLIQKAPKNKGRIFAVGTTSCRALETYVLGDKEGHTDLFIYPGYKFKLTDCLITNFHLPRTTLFILVCAFAGEKLIKKAYQEAIDKKYRFYSYGDAMLIV